MEINLKELVLDLELSNANIINNEFLKKTVIEAIYFSGAKIKGIPKSDTWLPHGLQFYVTIETSHLVLTTYPEANYLTINYATCGNVSFEKFLSVIYAKLQPVKTIRKYITMRPPTTTCDFKPQDCKKYPLCLNCVECKPQINP